MTRRIYLDLDGVMADFDGTFPSVFGLDHRDLADDAMWLHINGHPSFFRDLPPMNGAVEFFRTIEHLDPIILTACPKSNYAHVATQKVEWVRAHLSAHVTVLPVLGGSSKPLFMHAKGDILIDDYRRNTEAWANAGGCAILHRGFDGTASALEEAIGPYAPKFAQPVEAVENELLRFESRLTWESSQDASADDMHKIACEGLFRIRAALAHPRPTGEKAGEVAHVEARRCDVCDHIGINDASDTQGACHNCDWQGAEQKEDLCPECAATSCMAPACPECGGRYCLVASTELVQPRPMGVPGGLPRLELWFFRELTDEQRLKLFSIHGFPVDEIGPSHINQKRALRHLLTAAPAPGKGGEA